MKKDIIFLIILVLLVYSFLRPVEHAETGMVTLQTTEQTQTSSSSATLLQHTAIAEYRSFYG